MYSARIELSKLILGTRITYQATGDAGSIFTFIFVWTKKKEGSI